MNDLEESMMSNGLAGSTRD
jgi:hypothetical protein